MRGLTKLLGTTVTYPENREWQAVGPLDENGKGIFISLLYGDLESKGPVNFLMKYSAGIKAPPHTHSSDYYAVVISGKFRHYLTSEDEHKVLGAGATWFQKGQVVHGDYCVVPMTVFSTSFDQKDSMCILSQKRSPRYQIGTKKKL